MKLIDEKGRLFGLVNLIDFFVLLFFLAMLPALYFGSKIIFQGPVVQEPFGEDVKEIRLNCQFIKLTPAAAETISTGDREIDDKGRMIAEITELGAIEPDAENPSLKTRLAQLKLKTQIKEDGIYYKKRIIDYNSELLFNIDKYNVTASVTDNITRFLKVNVILKGLDERALNLIAVGDREIDAAGQVIAKILKIGKPEENSFEMNLGSGNVTIVRDADKKQLPAEFLLRCHIVNTGGQEQVYFKGERITYDYPFNFVTDKYAVDALPAKSYEIIPQPEREVRWVTLTVKFPGVISQICDVLKIGDTEKDFYGVQMATIVSVINNEPAQMMVLQEGRMINLTLPYQRDLLLSIRILSEIRDGTFYFKNYPIKMGNSVTFATTLYSITGSIIGMEIK